MKSDAEKAQRIGDVSLRLGNGIKRVEHLLMGEKARALRDFECPSTRLWQHSLSRPVNLPLSLLELRSSRRRQWRRFSVTLKPRA